MVEEDIPEIPVRFNELLGCYIICPRCSMLRAFTNTLPDEVEECPKCQFKVKPKFNM